MRIFKGFNRVTEDYSVENVDDSLLDRIADLEAKVLKLEEENIETSNTLYEIMHSVDAVDARIDILMEKTLWKTVSE